MEKRYKVIALHPFLGGCDMPSPCSFCYKNRNPEKGMLDTKFWLDCIPYFAELTDQIALGADGEPFMDSAFVARFANLCKKNGLLCNTTTNGKKLMEMKDELLQQVLSDITMVSVSYDSEKIKSLEDMKKYTVLTNRIKKLTKSQVGCNLLVDNLYLSGNGGYFIALVNYLFKVAKVDRIFCLYPKNTEGPNIIKYNNIYKYLTTKFEHFYVDDLTKEILEQGYIDWSKPCHYGKEIISINETGVVTGCSFDNESNGIIQLKEPKDLLNLKDIKIEERFKCPYILR